jgi:hypothetical protein
MSGSHKSTFLKSSATAHPNPPKHTQLLELRVFWPSSHQPLVKILHNVDISSSGQLILIMFRQSKGRPIFLVPERKSSDYLEMARSGLIELSLQRIGQKQSDNLM